MLGLVPVQDSIARLVLPSHIVGMRLNDGMPGHEIFFCELEIVVCTTELRSHVFAHRVPYLMGYALHVMTSLIANAQGVQRQFGGDCLISRFEIQKLNKLSGPAQFMFFKRERKQARGFRLLQSSVAFSREAKYKEVITDNFGKIRVG